MQLLVIRHGPAEARRAGVEDARRELTARGRRATRKAARGLRRIAPRPEVLAASPLRRAVQTAEIVGRTLKAPRAVEISALFPERSPAKLLHWLRNRPEETVAVVGHEPHLSRTVGYLLSGREQSLVVLKKGGACLLEFPGAVKAGRAVLHWALAPAQLRRMANGG
jgi:phosphohistidine phosphatase